jgi:dTDP-D-glucose 4,6-dehydratase
MKVLIVGAASGIGGSIAASLLQNTQHVIVTVDDLRAEKGLNNLQFALSHKRGERHKFYLSPMNDEHIAGRLFKLEKPDMVIFCKTPEPIAYHQSLVKTIHFARETGAKVMFLNADSWSHDRNESLRYAAEICSSESVLDTACIVNSCRVFGPRQEVGDPLVRAMTSIADSKWVGAFGASQTLKEWIYVKDLISAVESILSPVLMNGVYNVVSNNVSSEFEITSCLRSISSGDDFKFNKNIDFPRTEHGRIKSLGWTAKYDLREALEHTLSWYCANAWAREL